MRYIFELNHPKHYYQFKYIMRQLQADGHEIKVLARDKDVLLSVLKEEGVDYTIFGQHEKTLFHKITATPRLVHHYLHIVRTWRPNVIVSKASFYGTFCAWLCRCKSVIFPDSEVVKVTNRYVVPLATKVITPATFGLEFGDKHLRIGGLFEDCYLAPNVLQDEQRKRQGTSPISLLQKPYAVLRFVGWFANHDVNNSGFTLEEKLALVRAIAPHMNVYISSERPLPEELSAYRLPTPPSLIHEVLANADLYLGDSQTMATEAALLGTPAIRSNSFVGPNDMTNFRVLEQRYGLLRNVRNFSDVLALAVDFATHSHKEEWQHRRDAYFASVGDANKQIVDMLEQLVLPKQEKVEDKRPVVWIDLCHMAHYNFFRPFILRLLENNYRVQLTVLNRGNLPLVVRDGLKNLPIDVTIVGKHRLTRFSALWDANICRLPKMFRYYRSHPASMSFACCSHAIIACRFHHKPGYFVSDDPTRVNYNIKAFLSTRSYYFIYEAPSNAHIAPRVEVVRSLKEWAYLSPSNFTPNPAVLERYGLTPHTYLFVREVSVGTINYAFQSEGAVRGVVNQIEKYRTMHENDVNGERLKVIFSLEEKSKRSHYPADWITLQEPIDDIYSLIYYSAGLVSSGDAMTREAAVLGVSSYYLGIRHDMPANLAAASVADFNDSAALPFSVWLTRVIERTKRKELEAQQEQVRAHINTRFIDINEYLLSLAQKGI